MILRRVTEHVKAPQTDPQVRASAKKELHMTKRHAALAVLAAILSSPAPGLAQMNEARPVHLDTKEMNWEPSDPEGFPKGRTRKLLHMHETNNSSAALIRHPKGYLEPVHYHTTAGHSIYVLQGRMRFEGVEATGGDFFYTPRNYAHGPLEMLEETVFLIWSDGPLDVHLGALEDPREK
jgi:quercetin dioxygenase-like cupin family protein